MRVKVRVIYHECIPKHKLTFSVFIYNDFQTINSIWGKQLNIRK